MQKFNLSLFLGLAVLSPSVFSQSKKLEHRKETILVKFKASVSDDKIAKKLEKIKAKLHKKISGPKIHVVKILAGQDEKHAAAAMALDPDVEFAEIDGLLVPVATTSNDPGYPSQWGLEKIQAPYAWDTTTGSSSIIIAILDSGVDGNHPDLKPNIVPGYNTVSNSTDTSPIHGHGTWVAGVAAAVGNNGIGISGVCWNCKIMPVRVSDLANGYAYWSDLTEGVNWAANHGARVANASYQAWTSNSFVAAAAYMKTKGGVVVTSAGNDSAVYDTPANPTDLLVVSASTANDTLYDWSSRGNAISIAAPGNVYTTAVGGGYTGANGTSFSAPMTAGVVALLFSKNPSLTADQAMNLIKSSADDIGVAGRDPLFGYGRLNADRAVDQAGLPQPISGACGSANGQTFSSTPSANLCSSGTSSAVSLAGSVYNWSCTGSYGGLNAACSAIYLAPDTTAPSAPASLSASVSQVTKGNGKRATIVYTVSLAWGAATDNRGVVSYSILRNGVAIGSASTLSFADKNVVKGASYSYKIIAVDAAGNKSLASNSVSVLVN